MVDRLIVCVVVNCFGILCVSVVVDLACLGWGKLGDFCTDLILSDGKCFNSSRCEVRFV